MQKENRRKLNFNFNGFNRDVPTSKFAMKMEANAIFPPEPKSSYKVSNYQESYYFPWNPDALSRGNNYDTYDEMVNDDQIKSALSVKKELIVSPGWLIECEDEEVKDIITLNLSEKLESGFADSLTDILSSFEYGFSLSEVLFRKPTSGLIEVKDIITRPPHGFKFHLDEKGNLQFIEQEGATRPLFFNKNYFLHQVYQPDFKNPFGKSDLRSAYQAWKMKKFFMRFYAIYVERYASPSIVGLYPDGWDVNQIDNFFDQLKKIQQTTVMALPDGSKIDFKQAEKDSSNVYQNGINMLNTMIARAILMPDLLGLSGEQTSGGSYSLGRTQFQMFLNFIKREQESLASNINRKIIRPMVLANWGDIPCKFKFKEIDPEDELEYMRLWLDAVKGNVYKPSDEEINHFKAEINFPVSDGPIERPSPPPPPPNPFGSPAERGTTPSKKQPKQEEEEEADEDAENSDLEGEDNEEAREEGKKKFAENKPGKVKLTRPRTPYEKPINFAEIQNTLDMVEQVAFPELRRSGELIIEDFIEQVKRSNVVGKFTNQKFENLKPRKQKPLNKDFRQMYSTLYKTSFNQAQSEFFPADKKKFASEDDLLPDEFLNIIESDAFKSVQDYSIAVTGKMRSVLMEGIKSGLGEGEIVKKLTELGAKESEKWLSTVARTKSTEMMNRGRKSFYDNDPVASQIVEAYQFSAIMDDRTSDVCASLDEKVFTKGEFTSSIVPPLHFNCRSILVPVTKFEDYKTSKPPSMDSLKKKGGNLILKSKHSQKFYNESMNSLVSGTIQRGGSIEVLPGVGADASLVIRGISISNISRNEDTIIAVHESSDPQYKYKRVLKWGESFSMQFGAEPWVLPKGSGFSIYNSLDASTLEYTIEFYILRPEQPEAPIGNA